MDASEGLMKNLVILMTESDSVLNDLVTLMKGCNAVMNEAVADKMVCVVNLEDLALIMVDMEKSMMLCLTGKVKGVDH